MGSNPTPSAGGEAAPRRRCDSNPGWRLRASPLPRLRAGWRRTSAANPTPSAGAGPRPGGREALTRSRHPFASSRGFCLGVVGTRLLALFLLFSGGLPRRLCGAASVYSDGWPSGLRRTIGNRVGSRPRGFESHPVRCRQSPPRTGWASNPGWRLRAEPLASPSGRLAPDLGCESHPVRWTDGLHSRPTIVYHLVRWRGRTLLGGRGRERPPIVCIAVVWTATDFGAWLSPVERCVRVAEVPGSNPGAPIEEVV